jgi:pyruvate ferredoxin oxidoreductase alpha subunit
MLEALKIIPKVNSEFASKFGRSYGDGLIELIEMKGAEYALITVGAVSTGSARAVVEEMRKKGKKVGLIRIKCIRPFPKEEIINACKKLKSVGVIDRHISLGYEGPLATDVKATLKDEKVKVEGFVAGLGGRDIDRKRIRDAFETIMKGKEGYWLK